MSVLAASHPLCRLPRLTSSWLKNFRVEDEDIPTPYRCLPRVQKPNTGRAPERVFQIRWLSMSRPT